MIWNIGLHGTDHAKIIDRRTDPRKYFTHFNATSAVFAEGERRLHQIPYFAVVSVGFWRSSRHPLPVVFGERWLGVEGIHLRPAPIQEEKDDILGLGTEVWFLRIKRTPRIGHEPAQSQQTKAAA
jgi:hypothetical protein